MFSACLFCHASLGANQSIEHFPVGKRLAFDSERGRLWAVCPKCERWNLTPLEERWEALEECEREYRDTRKRVSTDNIALARLRDGTDLVRIGRPLLPEFAAWRYGEQLASRRRKNIFTRKVPRAIGFTAAVAYPVLMYAGLGFAAAGTAIPFAVYWTGQAITQLTKIPVAYVTVPGVGRLAMRHQHAWETVVAFRNDGSLQLSVSLRTPWRRVKYLTRGAPYVMHGEDAARALSDVIVGINHEGAKASVAAAAVRLLEDGATASNLLVRIASPRIYSQGIEGGLLQQVPHAQRLALEIALHEENERRAMAGELGALHARWEQAERVAKIADRELTELLDAASDNPGTAAVHAQLHRRGE